MTDELLAKKIEEFFSKYSTRKYRKKQILVYPDEDPSGIHFIKSGMVKQYDISSHGNEVIVNMFNTGAYFPMSWAVNKTTNLYYFETAEDSEICIAPAKDVLDFILDNRDIMFDLLSRLYSGSIGMQRRMAHMMAGNAHTRILYELIVESKRFGEQKDGQVELDMTETELARFAGLSRETTSREVNKLK